MNPILILITVLAFVAALGFALSCITPRTAGHKHRAPLFIGAHAFMCGLVEVTALPRALWRKLSTPRTFALANIAEGTYEGAKTYKTDAAIARHLLLRIGSDAFHVAVCGANQIPIGNSENESAGAEGRLGVDLLGVTKHTRLMVASEAITAGSHVYTAASGKVQDLPGGAGTYYEVGIALTSVAGDGDLIEVATCVARKVVVT